MQQRRGTLEMLKVWIAILLLLGLCLTLYPPILATTNLKEQRYIDENHALDTLQEQFLLQRYSAHAVDSQVYVVTTPDIQSINNSIITILLWYFPHLSWQLQFANESNSHVFASLFYLLPNQALAYPMQRMVTVPVTGTASVLLVTVTLSTGVA